MARNLIYNHNITLAYIVSFFLLHSIIFYFFTLPIDTHNER